ncbi:MAG: DUF2807 domain-containing protein [Bacteroidales bacterium]|nr:DUF2807 domain-containing protein [Bacteroidales bacterium]
MKNEMHIPVLLMIVSITVMVLASCQGGIVGNGKVETQEKTISAFNRLVINGNFHVFLEQSDKPSLRIELDENLFDIVKIKQEGSTLRIDTRLSILQASEKNLYIGVKDLEKMELTGSVKVVADSVLRMETLTILVSGAGRIDLPVEVKKLRLDLSGASECDFRGKVDELRIHLSGAGDIDATDLIARDVEVDMSGAGSARVNAKENLDVSISGVGSVRYLGEPKIHKNISGLGTLKRD